MADNRLTKKRLKNHFAYNWWKYALSAAVSAMLVSIVFAVTAYRPPAEKKVELYVLNGYIDAETFQRDFWPELQARKPEQEELTVLNINLTDSSNIYAPMQFSTYVAAQQGDLFLISRDEMRRITADGAQEALVARAKRAMIRRGGVDEAAAHRLLQKHAMNSGVSLRRAAEEILQKYGEDESI